MNFINCKIHTYFMVECISYYLDTCIWLNLFKREGDASKGVPYWKSAEQLVLSADRIIVSTIVLKELSFVASDKFIDIKRFFKESDFIDVIKTSPEDYDLARHYECEHMAGISFYDYLHIAIVKRLQITLITRDADMLEFSRAHVPVFRPEELLG